MKKREKVQSHEMTEEERLLHEQYIRELTEKNQQIVKKICTVLWCLAMVAWVILLVLDILHHAGAAKLLFHGTAAAITAALALRRLMDFFGKNNHRNDA